MRKWNAGIMKSNGVGMLAFLGSRKKNTARRSRLFEEHLF